MQIIVLFVFILSSNVFATTSTSKGAEDAESCKINWKPCSVDVSSLSIKGDVGDVGDVGEQGPKGPDGKMGEPGDRGALGQKGAAGLNGTSGIKGLRGNPGPSGPKGIKGSVGASGSCKVKCITKSPSIDVLGEGTYKKPVSCNAYFRSSDEPPPNHINVRRSNSFKVKCRKDSPDKYVTCLVKPEIVKELNEENLEKLSILHGKTTFWLSERVKNYSVADSKEEKGFDLSDFYFEHDTSKIEFLQKYSSSVTQKIKYHCKNSFVVPENKSEVQEKALHMLSWKGQLIGPTTTNQNPFSYVIEEDYCKDSADGWKHAVISLTDIYGRLPILDFHIRDIRKGEQKFYVELMELCFY